ncbi:hypothetical protein [Shewanella livingstonensis]|uniref:Uncharacterized protein n=1 Tax=Shewanella livingstonensis TaxID=150120 RepID=A0A3G8LWC9_9GAMM|nr:hypothetical protein [Shewanella livingstonensis]AZG73704.1 hypothetical protein EGC82_13590 [Shewanella livingstonensis]
MNEALKKDLTCIYHEVGAIVQASQHLEFSIGYCLTILKELELGPLSNDEFDTSMAKFSKFVFGRLIGDLKRVIKVGQDSEDALMLTLKERNFIIHNFFYDDPELFATQQGRKDLLKRVKLARANIDRGFQVIDSLTIELMRISGLSIEDVMADVESSMRY